MSENTITINAKNYLSDSITQKGLQIINTISRIDEVLNRQHLEVGITQVARSKLVEDLAAEAVNFTEVPAETANETSAETVNE